MPNLLSEDTVMAGDFMQARGANKVTKCLIGTVARTDTSAKTLGFIPNGSTIIAVRLNGGATGSDAGTTATVAIGPSLLTATSVKGAAGIGVISTVGATPGVAAVSADTAITATYAETGTASTAGGPWLIGVEYL